MKHFRFYISITCVLIIFPLVGLYAQKINRINNIRHAGNLFDPGYILQDRNNDSIIDFIYCFIILPEKSTESEIVSAANIAARLGYETSAINFDLTGYDSARPAYYDKPVIIIGRNNILLNKITSLQKTAGKNLKPGQGDISFFKADDFFQKGGIVLTGYDASGLLSSSNYFAGRYPDIWKPDGNKYSDIHKQFKKFLKDRNIIPNDIFSSRIIIDQDLAGVKKLSIIIDLPDKANLYSAQIAFKKEKKQNPEKKKNNKEKSEQKNIAPLTSLDFNGLHRIEIFLSCPDTSIVIDLLPSKQWNIKFPANEEKTSSPNFSLTKLYTIKGLYSDQNKDYVPDNVISYVSMNGTGAAKDLINFALRTGLETAGMRFPFVVLDGEEDFPEKKGFPVLFGTHHYNLKKLHKEQRILGVSTSPGTGFIQFVPEAFNKQNAIVISGTDDNGLGSISDYISRKLPYLQNYGKGNYQLEEVENDVRKFFQVKNAAAQATVAIHKLDTWLNRISEKTLESVNIEFAIKETPEGLGSYAENLAKRYFPEVDIKVETFKTGYGNGKKIFEENFEIPWEVDEFWKLFKEEVIPGIKANDKGLIEVRLSESPDVRNKIKKQIIAELNANGINPSSFEIVVLCAYKQGYSWLYDYILPKIKNKKVAKINIKYHTLKDSEEVRWQTVNANTRWLQEIFPVDTILARELNIPDSLITFQGQAEKEPIYTVTVTDKKGNNILEEAFDPKYVIRPFFDLFPEYESVRVTTGWLRVKINDKQILDKRIKTDPEIFWDHLQNTTYRKMIDYFMDIQDGRPSPANAPFFDEFKVELTLSEPNYRIGIDEEVISSTEALHEDILFHTLAFFNRIGGRYGTGSLRYPGRILPIINQPADGEAGKAHITFTGKENAVPELIFTYYEAGNDPIKQRYPLSLIDIKTPVLRGIEVQSGKEGINKLLFDVVATDSTDRYEEFKLRGTEISIDRAFITTEKLISMVNILSDMHSSGIYNKVLNYEGINEILFRITLEDSLKYSKLVSIKQGPGFLNTDKYTLPEVSFDYKGERIIQWDTPMPPDEVAENMSKLNRFPEINAYYMASSFLGQDVYAADIRLPVDGKYISQAKLNALKPSLMLIGRVHGNEVSSTSHQLRLAELCATDTAYKNLLKKMNLIIYPVVNPDGAQTAYDMYLENPDFMLHAGRYGALGTDVGTRSIDMDNLYPETGIATKLREIWLPDIFIDMHGVPSHEWVQYFAGYSAWVNSRNGGARNYWLPRGWYIPGFSWIEDKKYPELMKVQKAITDSITSGVMSLPEVRAMNRRYYDRYIKYGKQDPETYREYFYEGVQLEARLRGRKITNTGITGSKITYFAITTESADETAYGEWLQLVCRAGLANSKALMNYLANGLNRIEYQAKEYKDFVTRSVFRKKPVLPNEK